MSAKLFDQQSARFAEMVNGYRACLLWVMPGDDDDENPGDRYSVDDLSFSADVTTQAACVEFLSRVERAGLLPALESGFDGYDDSTLGHELALSRNGHGSGFFDQDYLPEDIRHALQEIARSMGESNLYIGDDGEISAD